MPLASQLLLQNDGVSGVEAGENLGFGTVGDAGLDIDLASAILLLGIRNFDGRVPILIVENSLFGDGEDVLVLFEENFGVGSHIGFLARHRGCQLKRVPRRS